MKRIGVILLSVLMLAALFGCSRDGGKQELWVVTEQTTWDRMNGQTWVLIDEFEKTHEGVTVRLDILPTQEQERSVYLQQLRTQILRGGGPDAYLLPTSNELVFDASTGYTYKTVEPLFADAYQAMENGIFRDISDLYDSDESLDKESLLQTVMDAGVLDGERYILPLRYDIPVIYADAKEMEKAGLSPELLEQNITDLMAAAAELGDIYWSISAACDESAVLGGWMDYAEQGVYLIQEQLSRYFSLYRDLIAQRADWEEPYYYNTKLSVRNYVWKSYQGQFIQNAQVEENEGKEGTLPRYPMHIGNLFDLLDYAPVYQYEENPLYVVPLRALDGQVVAKVTYYAAVGAGSEDPELAYEFLSQFLTQESQWEENRPQSKNAVGDKGRIINTTNASQYPGLIADGWPVRAEGSLNALWNVYRRQFYSRSAASSYKDTMRGIGLSELEESWAAVLSASIDRVCFGPDMTETFEEYVELLNDPETYVATDEDVSILAERLWWQMRLHVAEG